jgi:RND family efflux transporter MFP subunit
LIRTRATILLSISLLFLLSVFQVRFVNAAEPMTFDGLIEPYLVVEVGSSVAGVLKSVPVDRGDMVKKGQVVARLQAGVENAAVNLARTRAEMESIVLARRKELDLAKRNEQRVKKLFVQNAIPEREWDEIKTKRILAECKVTEALENKRLARMELNRAIEVVKQTVIRSPVSGIVVERFLSTGEYVEDHPILKLAQINPLNVEVILPVQLFGTIKVDAPATVKPEDPVGGNYKAKVKIVDPFIEAASGTFRVRLELPNPNHRLPHGLKCKVIFKNPQTMKLQSLVTRKTRK